MNKHWICGSLDITSLLVLVLSALFAPMFFSSGQSGANAEESSQVASPFSPENVPPIPTLTPTVTPTLPPPTESLQCKYYEVKLYWGEGNGQVGDPIFSGSASSFSCLNSFLQTCHSDGTLQQDARSQQDECVVNRVWEKACDCNKTKQTDAIYANCMYRCFPDMTPEAWKNIGFMDENCNFIHNQKIDLDNLCGDLLVRYLPSPISVKWEETGANSATVTQFQLDPGQDGKWYTWKASAQWPLLVYDPQHKGQVQEATQLFGHWTFGGRQSVSRGKSAAPVPWENGYQALATLDENKDGVINGQELEPLALWFDRNRNGVSENSEVLPALSAGLCELLLGPQTRDQITGDLEVMRGYKRLVGGKEVVGGTIDWFAEAFDSQQEAVQKMQRRALFSAVDGPVQQSQPQNPPLLALPTHNSISGAWHWRLDGTNANQPVEGLLTFKDEGGRLTGHSYVQTPVKLAGPSAANMLTMFGLSGRAALAEDGSLRYEFETASAKGGKTISTAFVSDDGNSLNGESRIEYPSGVISEKPTSFVYRWTAKRR